MPTDVDHAVAVPVAADVVPAKERVILAWWNTSLSPPTGTPPNEEARQLAAEVVRYLIQTLGVDCLGLGEITADDLTFLRNQCGITALEVFDGTLQSGRAEFDTGMIYDATRLGIQNSFTFFKEYGGRTLKVANRIDFVLPMTPLPVHVFVSHWPSRCQGAEAEMFRHDLGSQLRRALDDLRATTSQPAIILMGDYNDEPFDQSLSESLLASRDRSLVQKKSEFLYNPFWRHLGEPHPHIPGVPCNSYSGTCHHGKGFNTHWKTFDQIVFSSFFLGEGDWHLNEQFTKVLQFPALAEEVRKTKGLFDHFPVVSVIERTAKGE